MTISGSLRDRKMARQPPIPISAPPSVFSARREGAQKERRAAAFVVLLGIKRPAPLRLRDVAFRRRMVALLRNGSPL